MVKEDLFDWNNMHPEPNLEAICATLTAFFETTTTATTSQLNDNVGANYPDLVPRIETATARKFGTDASGAGCMTTNNGGPLSETIFLLAIFLGTCILLYFFPAAGP